MQSHHHIGIHPLYTSQLQQKESYLLLGKLLQLLARTLLKIGREIIGRNVSFVWAARHFPATNGVHSQRGTSLGLHWTNVPVIAKTPPWSMSSSLEGKRQTASLTDWSLPKHPKEQTGTVSWASPILNPAGGSKQYRSKLVLTKRFTLV